MLNLSERDEGHFYHVRRRMRERYGLELDLATYETWLRHIKEAKHRPSKHAIRLGPRSTFGQLWLLRYGPVDVYAVVEGPHIVTVMRGSEIHDPNLQRTVAAFMAVLKRSSV